MTKSDEGAKASSPTTVGEAAEELSRLYNALDARAVDLTSAYVNKQLAGKEGVTWCRTGMDDRATPFLDPVMRHKGMIVIAPGYNMWWEVLCDYRVYRTDIMVPTGEGSLARGKAITIRRVGRGFDPGDEYMVFDGNVLRAGYDHRDSVPSTGSDGKMAWSPSRDWVNGTFTPMTVVTDELRSLIAHLRPYGPSARVQD